MSKKQDLLGAPASNAGDAFHETWALREALRLLDPKSGLTEVYVEGVRDDPETDNAASWDGVDCALYYDHVGGPDMSRVELVQLKYSAASPEKSWTSTRFYNSTKEKGNNSVARRLADAFKGVTKDKTNVQVRKSVRISLVTNQPIAEDLVEIIEKAARGDLGAAAFNELHKATGLAKAKVRLFCECLALKGGTEGRDALRTDTTLMVSGLLEAPPAEMIDGLLMKIRQRMMPEGARGIDKAAVMGWFGLGQDEALFPREPLLEPLGAVIPRAVTDALAQAVLENPLVCLHGDGGCGKTTTAQTLTAALPAGSRTIVYDCYGAGAYRDQSQPRHRPFEAFMQLSNELARVTNTPLFFAYSTRPDMATAFRKKLVTAAKLFAIEHPIGLLVIMIDAADNAVHAAALPTPPQECFVHQLATFTELPHNVRIVISSRTARLGSLNLPEDAAQVHCPPFSVVETAQFLALNNLTGPENAIEDFHKLSTQNPRVQANAIETADTLADAIDFLRPNGQSLPDLFDAMIDNARSRAGVETSRARLSAAFSVLPTPVPITYLASICRLEEAVCRDLVIEITQRNVRIGDRGVDLANEDFEAYCEDKGRPETTAVILETADLLMRDRLKSEYAATHLFELLVQAGRKADLQVCLDEPGATAVIPDPVRRRQVELSRIRATLHVATLGEDDVSIAKTIYIGAESMPSAGKVKQVMRSNPDLSAAFIPDTIGRLVLNDPEARGKQGPLLMHLGAEHARKGEFFEARMRLRAANDWLQTLFGDRDGEHDLRWSFEASDIVAAEMAAFLQSGWRAASKGCGRWTPKSYALQLRAQLLRQIALECGPDAITALLTEIEPAFLFLAINALVRAGRCPSPADLAKALVALKSLAFEDFGEEESGAYKMTNRQRLVDEVMFFLDHASSASDLVEDCLQVLDRLSPPEAAELKGVSLSQPYRIDVAFRAAMMRARSSRQPLDLASIYPRSEEPKDNDPASEARQVYDRLRESREDVEKLIPVYQALASVRANPGEDTWKALTLEFTRLRERTRRPFEFEGVRRVIGRRTLELLALQDADMTVRLTVIGSLAYNATVFTEAHGHWLPDLLHDPRAHEPVTKLMEAQAAELISLQMKATEKADGLISIARMFAPFHRPNAEAYFSQALEIVEEVDLETLDVLHALCRMVERPHPDTPEMRARTSRFARLVHIAGGLLQSEDGFPQEEAVRALTISCPPVAAATVSRWTDEGFSKGETDLKAFIECGLASGLFSPVEAQILSGMAPVASTGIQAKALEGACRSAPAGATRIAEEIGSKVLLAMAPGASEFDAAHLCNFSAESSSWSKIKQVQEFQATHADALQLPDKAKTASPQPTMLDDIATPAWSSVNPFDAVAISLAKKANWDAGVYDQALFFATMRAKTGIADRRRHLDTLAEAARRARLADDEVNAILTALREWTDAAVSKWRRDALPVLIVDLGHKTLGYHWYDQAAINHLLEACNASDIDIRRLVVKLIETHAFDLGSISLLKLLAQFVRRLPHEDADRLIDFFLDRLETRLKVKDMDLTRHAMDTATLPETGAGITAAILYRYLGDIDARLRWRAAHALRQAAKVGACGTVGDVLSFAQLDTLPSYTFGDCPFHSLSADLQLAIAIARLSYEAPELIAQHEASLMRIWAKQSPHLLIGHYLSRALKQAKATGEPIQTSQDEIARMTAETAARAQLAERSKANKIDRFTNVGERFRFDSMDVVPSWYNPALDLFADLPQELLISTAEKWIVEKWGGHSTSSHWENEPRPRRLRDDYNLYGVRHGSLPTLERHWVYLQWHGLFTAIGELTKTHRLREPENRDSWDTYENWLSRFDTTYAGAWMADIRSPPPLNVRYWALPQAKSSDWLNETSSRDLSEECLAENGTVILRSSRESRTYSYGDEAASETVYTNGAFVPQETAAALLRAFAATPNSRDVYLPDSDWFGETRPNDPKFLLTTATVRPLEHSYSGLDEKDPTRFGVRGVRLVPSPQLKAAVGLIEDTPWATEWRIEGSTLPAAIYTAWSSLPNEERDPHRRENERLHVDGDRLAIEPIVLRKAMETLSCDLVVTVHITRSSGDEYAKVNDRKRRKEERAEVYLLRRDGRIETVDGDKGHWA
ncbi:hypothetical protein SLT36_12035 [Aminobacter sp. BA135]|uniref:hypothetical protein n=1 Tax=Aminobacter sp. BA135 TaxID=537596 RepID=UPI003D7ACE10